MAIELLSLDQKLLNGEDPDYVAKLQVLFDKVNEVAANQNTVNGGTDSVLALQADLEAIAGGDVLTSSDLEEINKRASAGAAGWL